MFKKSFKVILSICVLISANTHAGGIALSGTRIIYPLESKQVEVSTRNTSDKASFLVQSWVEDSQGHKDKSFLVTPPLFVSGPGNENKLRLLYSGKGLSNDKESLFYFNSKAIPSVNKNDTENKNILVIAATTRVKLFVRPEGLKPTPEKAPEQLSFSRSGKIIKIVNPTPYYITIGEMTIGGVKVKESLMVPPKGELSKEIENNGGEVLVKTINDYGAYTTPMKFNFK